MNAGTISIGVPLPVTPGKTESVVRRLIRDRLGVSGLLLVAVFVIMGIGAPLLTNADPATIDAVRRLEGVSVSHPLGTDHLGRDMFARVTYGARWSLGIVAVATACIVLVGVIVGTVAGYYGGWVDEVLMRVVDVMLAFPSLLLALAIAGTVGPGITGIMTGLLAVWWASYARMVRGMVLTLRERDFVAAARSLGANNMHIISRHVLPNVFPPVLILATVEMGDLVLAVAALGFLGLGAQPPTPEWGAMINDARPFILSEPRLMVIPGLAISASVAGFNLLGDALRDVLDPRRYG